MVKSEYSTRCEATPMDIEVNEEKYGKVRQHHSVAGETIRTSNGSRQCGSMARPVKDTNSKSGDASGSSHSIDCLSSTRPSTMLQPRFHHLKPCDTNELRSQQIKGSINSCSGAPPPPPPSLMFPSPPASLFTRSSSPLFGGDSTDVLRDLPKGLLEADQNGEEGHVHMIAKAALPCFRKVTRKSVVPPILPRTHMVESLSGFRQLVTGCTENSISLPPVAPSPNMQTPAGVAHAGQSKKRQCQFRSCVLSREPFPRQKCARAEHLRRRSNGDSVSAAVKAAEQVLDQPSLKGTFSTGRGTSSQETIHQHGAPPSSGESVAAKVIENYDHFGACQEYIQMPMVPVKQRKYERSTSNLSDSNYRTPVLHQDMNRDPQKTISSSSLLLPRLSAGGNSCAQITNSFTNALGAYMKDWSLLHAENDDSVAADDPITLAFGAENDMSNFVPPTAGNSSSMYPMLDLPPRLIDTSH